MCSFLASDYSTSKIHLKSHKCSDCDLFFSPAASKLPLTQAHAFCNHMYSTFLNPSLRLCAPLTPSNYRCHAVITTSIHRDVAPSFVLCSVADPYAASLVPHWAFMSSSLCATEAVLVAAPRGRVANRAPGETGDGIQSGFDLSDDA